MLAVLFILYLIVVGRFASRALNKFFGFTNNFFSNLLSIFAVFVSLGTIAGMAILFLPLNFWVLAGVFVLNAIIYILLGQWSVNVAENTAASDSQIEENASHKDRFAAVVFLLLTGYAFYLLLNSSTGQSVLSPWQTIDPQYIFVFFLSVLALGLLIFTKLKTNTIILFLILQTLLFHSYLPLTHKLIYGADGWRHIANEQRFLDGQGFLEAKIINPNASTKIESAKIIIGQLSYSNFWATNVILSKAFDVELLAVTRWLLPILWSLLFPVLLYEIALAFGWSRRKSLFFSWVSLLPFAWATAGSFSLPVNFGLLIWLFLVLLILKRINLPTKEQKLVLIVGGVSLFFGYSLFFILFWLMWAVAEFLIWQFVNPAKLKKAALVLICSLAIPAVELIAGYSKFDPDINWLGQIKQLLGNLSAFYLASGPRPHDIATGNIIFNQTPLSVFVPNLITYWRWWLVVFSICFFGVVIYGFIKICRDNKINNQWLGIVAPGIIFGYIISNYFLSGSHILARRLDGVVVLFLMLLFFYGLTKIYQRFVWKNKTWQILAMLVLSLGITASYSLGPDTNTVNVGEYEAASYVWLQEQLSEKPCVLADTYPLLALEAVSAKQIIGGGFPIDADFGQPERVKSFEQMNIAINDNLLNQVGQLTDADHCWFIGKAENFQKQGILKAENVFGDSAIIRYNIVNN
ncbi:MAG: hypothetical protein A2534_04000 [Candidatus Magasanikbacteria bacterium RIFOXYD2_FULL_39_9]|uniref:Glycosyltransferase RgtA/B/C/D-like domain-containing protein n=1 Tax=Candidatus Magasanikbacteria bacterium RIFOXYD1_FULL_40_23 TaxID=1798705 RepID=A0A1F6PB18_9BACT|nr:MAG: hypothetical protein A2534_04000 [Candidatus Magasanikbacteria bacterium RIFOXYD2_FULL_39_9]OGH93240.1 MAG: hypothetical protein A2563_01375 [Candidatus Magasanikbacteria bacterium RIFOXYD1_FULL_40_23]